MLVCVYVKALSHPYFFAMPYPTHPSKLPKPAKLNTALPLEEVDGNVDLNGSKANPQSKLKRKHSIDELGSRSIARKLDFSQPLSSSSK